MRTALSAVTLLAALTLTSATATAGTLLVANKSEATLSLIDLASGEAVATLPTGAGPHEVAVSPDGATAAVANYGDRGAPGSTLTLVDVAAAKVLRTIELGPHTRPHGLVWLDARRIAVTTEGSRHLVVVAAGSGEVVLAVPTGQDVSHMVAVTPDGGRAFVANIGSGSVTAIDLGAGKKLRDVATGDGAEGIAASPDGRQVWVTNRGADTVSVIDAATLEIMAELPVPGFPIRVEFTPDGKTALVTCARAGVVALYDVASREPLARIPVGGEGDSDADRLFGDSFEGSPVPIGIEVAPDGKRAWIACSNADVVAELDLSQRRPAGILRAGRQPDGMAYSGLAVVRAGKPGASEESP